MKYYVILAFLLLLPACSSRPGTEATGPVPVEIVRQEDGGFQLLRGGEPYYVKGTVARDQFLDVLVEAGGNSVRSRADHDFLDKLHGMGLTIMFNLPVQPERSGMDYDDTTAVRQQFDEVMALVREYKDHPAVLFWSVGNELDWIPPGVEPNWKVYDHLNDLAIAIHEEDPNHPVMTVMGTGDWEKIDSLISRAPELDLLGINSYADIGQVHRVLEEHGWDKPYLFTEWGPSGAWQVAKTSWGRPIEETEAEKAEHRRQRYETAILGHNNVLGSYVFHWWSRQETTHTWYGMFDEGGRASESVDAMQYVWTGEWPENQAPHLISLQIEGKGAHDDVTLEAGRSYTAMATVEDPDGDTLEYAWELVREPDEYGAYAGGGEIRQPPLPDTVPADAKTAEIQFTTPPTPGEYRLFMYAYDGNEHFTTANIPILVE